MESKTTNDFTFILLCFDKETQEARSVYIPNEELKQFVNSRGKFLVSEEVIEGIQLKNKTEQDGDNF